MATKIKRCLYVGLGGTGMSSLLNAKKMFIETYGEVPPMIGFLGVDTDGGAYTKETQLRNGRNIRLEPFEQMSIQVAEPMPFYNVNSEHFSWINPSNIYAMTSMMLGAGQVRSNGRFAITYNYENLANKVHSVMDRISNATISNNPKYELSSSNIEIHVIFSVCGGTGCGSFLDMAYLLRREAPNHKITGYAVLPDVFTSMANGNAQMARVKSNAFGAIQDLDYLMHLDATSKKVHFDYVSTQVPDSNERPFNTVYFVDNRNANGDVYSHVDQLSDMISLALVTSAGELSSAAASVSDNLEKMIAAGTMDVEGKRAWCAGMGVCEIIFKGSELKYIYARKAVKRIIERLFNSCVDSDAIVNNWIDGDDIKIRENGGDEHNDVIDYLLSLEPQYQLSDIDDKASAAGEVNDYLNGTAMCGADAVPAKLKDLKKRVFKGLRDLMVKTVNQECGIGASESVLLGIQQMCNVFLEEMNKEYNALMERQPGLQSGVDNAVSDLSAYNGRFFKSSSTLQEYVDDLIAAVMNVARNKRDALRHSHAISFYTSLKQEVEEQYTKIQNIKRILTSINESCTADIARTMNAVNKESQIFQIDLAKQYVNQIVVKDAELVITDLLQALNGDKVYDFDNRKSDDLKDLLVDFASNVKAAKLWENTSIDEVINRLDEDTFAHLVNTAINKSKPLIQYNDRGYRPDIAPTDSYYIGVSDKKNSRMAQNDYFKGRINNPRTTVDFANIGSKDRIIIYRQFGVFPAFHISSLSTYKASYEKVQAEPKQKQNGKISCHFDDNVLLQMKREEYSLLPKKKNDDTLELWVWGLIFCLIKNEQEEGKDRYMYKNSKEGDEFDDCWMDLGEYRDEAFNEFKKHVGSIREEYHAVIENESRSQGADAMKELRKQVKDFYYENFSEVKHPKDVLRQKGMEAIKELVTQELKFVKAMPD